MKFGSPVAVFIYIILSLTLPSLVSAAEENLLQKCDEQGQLIWLQTWQRDIDQDDQNLLDQFESEEKGVAAGISFDLAKDTSIDISLSRAEADTNSFAFGTDDQSIKDINLTLFQYINDHGISISAGYGEIDTKRDRRIINFNNPSQPRIRLLSDFDTQIMSFGLQYSYYITSDNPLNTWMLSPTIGINYNQLTTDNYIEFGPNNEQLSVSTEDEEQVIGNAGLTFSWAHFRGDWMISPSITTAFEHDFKVDPTSTEAIVRDVPIRFSNEGYDIEDNRFLYGAAINFSHLESLSFGVVFQAQKKDDYSYKTIMLNLQLDI